MLNIVTSRRGFLRVGGVALPAWLRARAMGQGRRGEASAVIQVVLGGGPSQIDSYDPKPEAPVEFRGEFGAIATNVPGVSISEHFPRQARIMDKLAIVRSLHHATSDHAGGTHWMMTGHAPIEPTPIRNERPSLGSVVARMRGGRVAGLPSYVGIPGPAPFGQGAYLGPGTNPFALGGDPSREFTLRNLDPPEGLSLGRLDDRRGLLAGLDRLERSRDASGLMEGMDRFTAEAYAMVTGPSARRAFDLSREDPRTRDRYGRTSIGQGCLLARRLVEAGVPFVTVVEGGWDHHTEVFANCRRMLPALDDAIAGLVGDLHDRGLDRKALVLVWGEFGRTPRVNGSGGRDHWPSSMSAVLAGAFTTGQVIGASDRRGERPADRALRPEDLLRTVYEVLGIDPLHEFPNEAGRPLAVLNQGRPIIELL